METGNESLSYEQIQYAALPYVLSATPEGIFWNRMMSFFEANNIEHYKLLKDARRAGVKIYYFLILKKNEIDQQKLVDAVCEYFDNEDTFPDFIYLYAAIPCEDGATDIVVAIDPDIDLTDDSDDFYSPADEDSYDSNSPAESFFWHRLMSLFEKNNISDYEVKVLVHGNGVKLFQFEMHENADARNKFSEAVYWFFRKESILNAIVLTHVLNTFEDGTIKLDVLVDTNADVMHDDEEDFYKDDLSGNLGKDLDDDLDDDDLEC